MAHLQEGFTPQIDPLASRQMRNLKTSKPPECQTLLRAPFASKGQPKVGEQTPEVTREGCPGPHELFRRGGRRVRCHWKRPALQAGPSQNRSGTELMDQFAKEAATSLSPSEGNSDPVGWLIPLTILLCQADLKEHQKQRRIRRHLEPSN